MLTEFYITAGRNRLYASQGRVSTNDLAATSAGLVCRQTRTYPASTTTSSRTASGTT